MDKHFTIVKILSVDEQPTQTEVNRWRDVFANHPEEVQKFQEDGEIFVEKVPIPENEQYITLIKVGDDNYKPTYEDLETWRKVFEDAQKDPDFKVFTHSAVDVSVIHIGKIIGVE
jgi:hypothetical protein